MGTFNRILFAHGDVTIYASQALEHLKVGDKVEVEGLPQDEVGGRTFSSSGGDWQVCQQFY